ncbi:MAG: aminoacyl-tRNA hydrolase [Bacilli bacterium]|nr:aminoacyl-tRNA hydrolase [Bacilli bacterium]
MKLIVGLGNPGRQYKKTRHNIGFMVLDALAEKEDLDFNNKAKFKGEIIHTTIRNQDVILLKPLTYMNNSGEAVQLVKQFYQINDKDILVIHDDLDLPNGKIRIRQKGSSGGHKGIKSIIDHLKSENFHRLRIGIGKSDVIPVIDYVLENFSKDQIDEISNAINISIDIIYDWLSYDIVYVMNKYN